jgi:prepilin-type N-terminal cleavage/methylation domain-containing protein
MFKKILKNFDRIDATSIEDQAVANRVRKLQRARTKQAGFTLLELLVVVAILAAIAGTATIALQDTDARASAAAHVAMMDEINKGVRTYRVLNKNALPDDFDSLLQAPTGFGTTGSGSEMLANIATTDLVAVTIDSDTQGILDAIGMKKHRVVYGDAPGPTAGPTAAVPCDLDSDGTLTDVELKEIINSRANQTVAGLIYSNGNTGDDTGGCGASHALTATSAVAIWTGGSERLTGNDSGTVTTIGAGVADLAGDLVDTPVYMGVGLGFNSTLFDASQLGGMTSVPVYRHVAADEYNRFIALFQVGTVGTAAGSYQAIDQVTFTAVVDGAGDTKEEELGEWDGTRNTI